MYESAKRCLGGGGGQYLYPSPNIVRKTNGHRILHAYDGRGTHIGFWWETPEGKISLGRPRRGRIILKWILEIYDGMGWTG
jgi:hypothetical protein